MTENRQTRLKIQIGSSAVGATVSPEMSAEDFLGATPDKLSEVAGMVDIATQSFFTKLSALEQKPKECVIEFGVNAGGEAGVPFVTKGTIGANFKVSLKWEWS